MQVVGLLWLGSDDEQLDQAFRDGLRELGYSAGSNLLLEYRYADGRPDQLARQVEEFVQLKVDVIVAGGPVALPGRGRPSGALDLRSPQRPHAPVS